MIEKFIKSAAAIFLVAGLTACSLAADNTDKLEAVVENFFDCIEIGDLENLSDICSTDVNDELGIENFSKTFDSYLDEEEYGEVFVNEVCDFRDYAFKNIFIEPVIENSEISEDETLVYVTGKYRDYSDITFDTSEMETLAQNYALSNSAELSSIYKEEGYDAMMIQIYSDIAPDLFDMMKSRMDDAKTQELEAVFTLQEREGTWKITDIASL